MTFLLLGIAAGMGAGFFGIGGGIILVPALVWFFKLSQHQAQGISLAALVLPVGIFGAYQYYKSDPFPLTTPLWIALGITFGAFAGGHIAHLLPERPLRIAFGCLLFFAGAKMILGK